MTVLRSLLYNLFFFSWTALVAVLGIPALFISRRAVSAVARTWARGLLAAVELICGLGHEIRGRENLPEGPFILAAKHQSAWDVLIFPTFVEDFCYVLKKELLAIPLFGWYLTRQGAIAVDRKGGSKALRKMMSSARAAADQGWRLIIFPEGTRVAPGDRKPYHPGIAALYRDLGIPVVPVALNSGLFWRRRAFTKLPGRISLVILPPIPPGLDRRAFMARLHAAIEGESARLGGYESAAEPAGSKAS